jgi:hypothetical protein
VAPPSRAGCRKKEHEADHLRSFNAAPTIGIHVLHSDWTVTYRDIQHLSGLKSYFHASVVHIRNRLTDGVKHVSCSLLCLCDQI